jgi:uncharacterized FlaG/YvyC family protein
MADNNTGRLELIATCKVQTNAELYKVIDFLNKNLKNYHVMFGLTKKDQKMIISIYEVN